MKIIFSCIFLISAFIYPAFSEDQFTNNQMLIGYGFQFGSAIINGTDYDNYHYKPYFEYANISCGLDINFDFNESGTFLLTEWNSWQSLVSKIDYFKYGSIVDPLYFETGFITNFTLGDGFIVNNYSDNLDYPEVKTIGLIFDADLGIFGFNSFTDNILDWDLLGIRPFVRPFYYLDFPIINNLEIGATMASDIDPFYSVPQSSDPYAFSFSNCSTTVNIIGLDMTLPLVNLTNAITLSPYFDYAYILNKGTGEAIGSQGMISFFIPYKIGLDFSQPGFTPSYFDIFYNADRLAKYQSLSLISNNDTSWLISSGLSVLNGDMTLNYRMDQSFSNNSYPETQIDFSISRKIIFDMIGINMSLVRRNVSTITNFLNFNAPDSIFLLSIDYVIMQNIIINLEYKDVYNVDSSGNITPFMYSMLSTEILF